jgi:hypothetical protein
MVIRSRKIKRTRTVCIDDAHRGWNDTKVPVCVYTHTAYIHYSNRPPLVSISLCSVNDSHNTVASHPLLRGTHPLCSFFHHRQRLYRLLPITPLCHPANLRLSQPPLDMAVTRSAFNCLSSRPLTHPYLIKSKHSRTSTK